MEQSILDSIRKLLGVPAEYDVFDVDIAMHINTSFATLHQLGIGPVEGFAIDDSEATWADFIQDQVTLNSVKSYVYIKVRLVFDPPSTSFAVSSMEKTATELEWRLNVRREEVTHPWQPPVEI